MAKAATATPSYLSQQRRCPRQKSSGANRITHLSGLADSTDVHSQVKWAHWNVKGAKDFLPTSICSSISVATHLEDHIDTIAERISALGGVANGNRSAKARREIPASPRRQTFSAYDGPRYGEIPRPQTLATTPTPLRTGYPGKPTDLEDAITVDLFTTITREMDKDLWFIEAHTQS